MPHWLSSHGMLYDVDPAAKILTISSDKQAVKIAAQYGVKIKDVISRMTQMPWAAIGKDYDAIHYVPQGNRFDNLLMGTWDVESTAWFNTNHLKNPRKVPVQTQYGDHQVDESYYSAQEGQTTTNMNTAAGGSKTMPMLYEVNIDNARGWGNVPDNQNVDYLGMRVKMKPSVFLKLATPLSKSAATSADAIKHHIATGGSIASAWLIINIPPQWQDGDMRKPARVVGHEGRNRMMALQELEGDQPVEVHLFFGGGLRARHITPLWKTQLNQHLIPQTQTKPIAGPFFTTSLEESSDTTHQDLSQPQYTPMWDKILRILCHMIDHQLQNNSHKYGDVGAAIVDPSSRIVAALSSQKHHVWNHAEHNAIAAYEEKYGEIPPGSILITTCSPCSARMADRHGVSCTSLINKQPIHTVYCGFKDPTQPTDDQNFDLVITQDPHLLHKCEKYAQTFMDWEQAQKLGAQPSHRADEDTTRTTSKGAPGTLKAKITRLYSGDVTCAKTERLKRRDGATAHDKAQANWFQNKHCGGASRVDEIFQEPAKQQPWRSYGSGDHLFYDTNFSFDNHNVVVEMIPDTRQVAARYVFNNVGIPLHHDMQGYTTIFRVDNSTEVTGEMGPRSGKLFAQVVSVIRGFLQNHRWDYVVFTGEEGSRDNLYQAIADRLAQQMGGKAIKYRSDFVVYRDRIEEAGGVGLVVPGVNMPAGMHKDEIRRQARKFGFKTNKNGVPPQLRSDGKY